MAMSDGLPFFCLAGVSRGLITGVVICRILFRSNGVCHSRRPAGLLGALFWLTWRSRLSFIW
jgi:hypothetical protein